VKPILIAIALALLSGAAIADNYQDFNAGIAARNGGDDTTAVTYLSSALAASDLPAELRPTALLARGEIYAKTGRLDAANADFIAAITLRPDDIEALLDRGSVENAQGHKADAIADYKRVVALRPDDFLLYNDLATAYIRAGEYAAPIEGYSDFVTKRSKDPAPLEARAVSDIAAKQFDDAIKDASASIAIYSKWSAPYDALGEAYIAKGDFQNAKSAIDDAIRRDENNAVYYLTRGYIAWLMGDMDAADRAFSDSLEKDAHQNYSFIWLNMTSARKGKQVPAGVEARFSGATEAKWPGPLVLLYLGRMQPDAVLKLTGDDPDTLNSKECATHFFVGEWFVAQGKPAEAKPLLLAAAGGLCAKAPIYERLAVTDLARLSGGSP
jgi:lipoprotein NlpI